MSRYLEMVEPQVQEHPMPFVPGIKARGTFLFISGATASPLVHRHPHVEEELAIPEDIGEQTRRCMENIRLVLDAVGATFDDIVKTTIFNTRMDEQDRVNEVYTSYFKHRLPTRSHVGVSELVVPGLKVEIEAIALLPDEEES